MFGVVVREASKRKMWRRSTFSLFLFLFVFGVDKTALSGDQPRIIDDSQIAALPHFKIGSEINCPSQQKGEFLKQFSQRIDVQRQFTIFPLKYKYLDLDRVKDIVKIFVSFSEFPYKWKSGGIFPNEADRKGAGINNINVVERDGHIVVELTNNQNLSGVDYYFIHKSGCWRLYMVHDTST